MRLEWLSLNSPFALISRFHHQLTLFNLSSLASQRLREAAAHKAEGEKILAVKAAEADAESKYLSGLGVAKQRKAIVDGLKDTVSGFAAEIDGAGPQDVIDLLLVTQYFDMMKEVGGNSKSGNTLFLPHGPHSIDQLREQLKNSFMTGGVKQKVSLLHDF